MPRNRTWTAALVAFCLALTATGTGAQKPASFLESLDVRVVNLEVYVTDRQGHPVDGLTVKDFTLLEDGKKQKISHFSYVPGGGAGTEAGAGGDAGAMRGEPTRIVLFFDNFAIQPQGRKMIVDELRRLFDAGPFENTLWAVASYEGYVRMNQTFTDDPEAVLAAIEESGKRTSLGVLRAVERDAIVRQGLETLRSISELARIPDIRGDQATRQLRAFSKEVDAQAERQRQHTQTQVFGLSHLVNGLAALPGRKSIVYFSEGMPMRPGEELYTAIDELLVKAGPDLVDFDADDSEQQDLALDRRSSALGALDQVRRSGNRNREIPDSGIDGLTAMANAGRVSFYTLKADIGDGGLPAEFRGEMRELFTPELQGIRFRNLAASLSAMAHDTGGRPALGTGALELIAQARADHGGYYFLGFEPKHDANGAFHKLKVKLKARGLEVRHRTAYMDKPPLAKVADRTTAALLLADDENSLGVRLDFGPPAAGPDKELKVVPVMVSIPLDFLAGLPDSMQKVQAALYIAARDQEGRAAPVQQLPVELDRTSEGGLQTTGFRMLMREGPQRLAVGLVVPTAGASAFVSGEINVGGGTGS